MSDIVKTIYALYAISDDDCAKIHAISLNQESLQEILVSQVSTQFKEMVKFEIKPISVYLLVKLLKPDETTKKMLNPFGTSHNLTLMLANSIKVDKFKNKIFAFNKITTKDCIQCLVLVAHDDDSFSDKYKEHLEYVKSQKMFKENMSELPIDLDVYYDEGILNA